MRRLSRAGYPCLLRHFFHPVLLVRPGFFVGLLVSTVLAYANRIARSNRASSIKPLHYGHGRKQVTPVLPAEDGPAVERIQPFGQ